MIKDLQKVIEQDPLAQLDEQDKELIWKMRYLREKSHTLLMSTVIMSGCVCVCVSMCL